MTSNLRVSNGRWKVECVKPGASFSGDNWLIAKLGEDHNGCKWYVTTDCVPASMASSEPEGDANAIVAWRNAALQGETNGDPLRRIIAAYDAYRGRGVSPAPNEYQNLVAAIEAARGAVETSAEQQCICCVDESDDACPIHGRCDTCDRPFAPETPCKCDPPCGEVRFCKYCGGALKAGGES